MSNERSPVPPQPLWRQSYDTIEAITGPPLARWVRSEPFAAGIGIASQLRRELERRADRATRQMLHLFNLPAGTDVTRLLAEVGDLRKQVRHLSDQLDARDDQKGRRP
jgi:hypothetical protein